MIILLPANKFSFCVHKFNEHPSLPFFGLYTNTYDSPLMTYISRSMINTHNKICNQILWMLQQTSSNPGPEHKQSHANKMRAAKRREKRLAASQSQQQAETASSTLSSKYVHRKTVRNFTQN